MKLRRAGPSDAAAVRALVRSAYAKWIALIGREPFPMTADYDKAIIDHMIDLHEENGQLLALIELIPAEDHLLIENVTVHPTQQGKGLGEGLVAHAESLAAKLGFNEVRLYTNALFASNIAFYAKRGFSEFRREPIPSGGELVRMRKHL